MKQADQRELLERLVQDIQALSVSYDTLAKTTEQISKELANMREVLAKVQWMPPRFGPLQVQGTTIAVGSTLPKQTPQYQVLEDEDHL